jgi:hypothetical protein
MFHEERDQTEEKQTQRYDLYDVVEHRNGYLVRLTLKSGNTFYCDREHFWMRIKNSLKPSSQSHCRQFAEQCTKEDSELYRIF